MINKKQNRILIAEDDDALRNALKDLLEDNDFIVYATDNGIEAQKIYLTKGADLVLLDIDMPGKDGRTVTSRIREESNFVPVIIMTGSDEHQDEESSLKIYGAGATSFVRKPFYPSEMMAKIRALLNLTSESQDTFCLGDLQFNPDSCSLIIGDISYQLKGKENHILKILLKHKDQLVEKSFLLDSIWKDRGGVNCQMLRNNIAKLKKKLKNTNSVLLQSIHGRGYILELTR